MVKNVGKTDRILRFFLGLILIWLGLFVFNGIEGNILGILVALVSIMPFYMSITQSCFVFRWLKIYSLSKKEFDKYGEPYPQIEE